MGSLLGLIALIVALIAVSRLNRLQRDLENLEKKLWLLEKVGTPPIVERPHVEQARPLPSVPPTPARALEPQPLPPLSMRGLPATPWSGDEAIVEEPEAPPGDRPPPPEPEPPPSRLKPDRDLGSLEAAIGGSWLNRIGIALLVIGIVFALGYSLTVLGPAGKAALATATSLCLIGAGVVLERRDAYRFYGRGLIGGGWAALYATAYAMHELQATRIVASPLAGFALLMLVGAGMIFHSLRYRNQGLTSLAYGLGYAAIFLHSISAYTLAAAALLGLGTVLHLLKRSWYGVALGGIAATYGSLFVWYLRQSALTPETLRLGLTALALDWLVFLAADFGSDPADEPSRLQARSVGLLNALGAGFLSFLAWTRVMPGGGWQPLAVLGAAYVLTSATLRRLGRKVVHPLHSLVATLFLAVAAERAFQRTATTWAWIVEAQALVLVGIWLKDRFHRWLGCALFLAPMAAIVGTQLDARMGRPDGSFDPTLFLLIAGACGCFYFTQGRLKAHPASAEGGWDEARLRSAFSYAAFVLILLGLWVQLPKVYVAPAGAAFMLLLFELAGLREERILREQSYLAAVYTAVTCLGLSAPSHAVLLGSSARIPAMLAVAAGYLYIFRRHARGRLSFPDIDQPLRPVFSWVATGLVALVVWLEARPVMVGPAWMILALLLIEAGIAFAEPHLRRPGYVTLVAAGVSLAMSNLTATDMVFGWSIRVVTMVPGIAAAYYLWWRLRSLQGEGASASGDDLDERFGRLLSYLGAALAGLFARFQFGLDGAALRWSLAMVALFVLGDLLGDADFRFQAYLLGGAVFVRAVGFDFQTGNPVLGMDGPLTIATIGVACFIALGTLARRRLAPDAAAARSDRRSLELEAKLGAVGQDLMWILAVALAGIYLYRTFSGFLLIVAWAVEGLCATAAGFGIRARSMRLSGLALLGVGLVMTVYRAFTTFDTAGRIISFMVLGVVLLLISFGYTRYREYLRKAL